MSYALVRSPFYVENERLNGLRVQLEIERVQVLQTVQEVTAVCTTVRIGQLVSLNEY